MTVAQTTGARPIGRRERWTLRLVFGGPVSLWVPLARLVGVKVGPGEPVDEACLVRAEAGAVEAGRRFGAGLLATGVFLGVMVAVLPAQESVLRLYVHGAFHAIGGRVVESGGSYALADATASIATLAIGVSVGLLNAVLFGGVPLLLLRRCALAAAPAVSVALTQGDEALEDPQASEYPRVAFAVEHILHPTRRWEPAR